MIDAIITLIRGVGVGRRGRARRCSSRPSSSARSRRPTSSTWRCGRLAALERQKLRDEYDELAQTIAELEAILADEVEVARRHQGRADRDQGQVRRRAPHPITTDPGDLADLDLIEDEELVLTLTHRGYVKTVSVDQFRTQARGGKGVRGGKLARGGLGRASAVHHRALVPAVLLEPRPRVPPARRTRSR